MLHTVIRASIDSASMALPRNSMTCPEPPPVPILAMTARTMSLAVTPGASSPSTTTAMVRNGFSGRVWVASTCSTSDVPIPNASAPKAPWVEVWLSPQTMVSPGWVSPSCGPMMWTMPWSMSPMGNSGTPNSAQLRRSVSTWVLLTGSRMGPGVVGTLWSSVATVRSVRRTVRPASRRPSKACGLVTSWRRCRSMYSRSGSPSAWRTTCASQTFSASVPAIVEPPRISRPSQRGPTPARRNLRLRH